MKTFKTTIYDLRGRHLIHILGMALGLFLVAGYTVTFGRLIDDLLEWKKYGALVTFTLLITYGLILLVPKRMIEKRRSTRLTFYLSSGAFILHMISTVFSTTGDNDRIYAVVGILMALIAFAQIIAVAKGANQPAQVNPCNPSEIPRIT
jgi:putative Ca2+/H+ antiporter (TMEM165/GDT1 family)